MLVQVFIPTEEDVKNLKVGDLACNCFGWFPVTRIFARGVDVKGHAFVCFYTGLSENSEVSASYKVGELVRTVALCNLYSSTELSIIEKNGSAVTTR